MCLWFLAMASRIDESYESSVLFGERTGPFHLLTMVN